MLQAQNKQPFVLGKPEQLQSAQVCPGRPRLNDHGITNQASVMRYIEEIGNTTGPVLHVIVGTIHTATVPWKALIPYSTINDFQ